MDLSPPLPVAMTAVRSKTVVLSVVVDSLLIAILIVEICKCSMICSAIPCVHSSFTIISTGKRELVALLYLSSWCLVIVMWFFHTFTWGCLQFVIVVFPDLTHLLFLADIRS